MRSGGHKGGAADLFNPFLDYLQREIVAIDQALHYYFSDENALRFMTNTNTDTVFKG